MPFFFPKNRDWLNIFINNKIEQHDTTMPQTDLSQVVFYNMVFFLYVIQRHITSELCKIRRIPGSVTYVAKETICMCTAQDLYENKCKHNASDIGHML